MGSSIESLIDSYEAQINRVGSLMRQAVEVLKKFDSEQGKKIVKLRDLLAKTKSFRRKDFDSLMAEIWIQRRKKEERAAHTLDAFLIEQEKLAAWLRKVVTDSNIGLEEFKLLSQNILTRQKTKQKELTKILRELHLEQEELETGLKKLLQKGKKVQIKDFKVMIKIIRLRQEGRQDEVSKMLDELLRVEEEVTTQWHKVVAS